MNWPKLINCTPYFSYGHLGKHYFLFFPDKFSILENINPLILFLTFMSPWCWPLRFAEYRKPLVENILIIFVVQLTITIDIILAYCLMPEEVPWNLWPDAKISLFFVTDSDHSYYNLILKKAGQFLSNLQINLLKFALSIRAYSPTVHMFQQVCKIIWYIWRVCEICSTV